MHNIPPLNFFVLRSMKKIALVLIIYTMPSKISAQYFERVYQGLNLSYIGSLDNTVDTAFIICGTQDGGFLMKIKRDGNPDWTSRDSGNVQHSAGVIQNSNGHFVVIGSCNSLQYNSEAVVATYDASGDPITHFRIPPTDGWGTWGTTITRSPDRLNDHYCYYVDGFTSDNAYYLDNQEKIAGDMTAIGQNSITMDNNGNYYTAANLAFDMDSLFNWRNNVLVLSSNHFSRSEYFFDTEISSAAITADGGVLLAGLYDSLGTKYLRVMKFDAAANLLWDTYYSDSDIFSVNQVSQTSDGGFAILCAADDGNNMHIAFIKADDTGNAAWKREYFGSGTSVPRNFVCLDDGYAILGSSAGDPYVIRTDSLGRTNATAIALVREESNTVRIYPNPSNGIVHIAFAEVNNSNQYVSILDMTGRMVYQRQLLDNESTVDLSFLAKGVYQCRFTASGSEIKSSKFVIE
jgi:hypothetical protein